ncbi:MAG: GNAT family N-acetyltransferase [Pseudomonadales bacterium]|jgi:hypothetical protein
MGNFSISIENDGQEGRYVARADGIDEEAEITFTRHGPRLISADHTNAPEALRGTGIAAALVDHLVADARRRGIRVLPACPYIQARYAKHPEWSDVFTVGPGEEPVIGAES